MEQHGTGVPEVVPTQTVVETETKPAKHYRPKNCKKCGVEFIPVTGGAQKYCEQHKIAPVDTDQRRDYEARELSLRRKSAKEANTKKDARWSSKTEITKKEAIEILE